jgi:porin
MCLGLCVLPVAVAVSAFADEPLEKPMDPPSPSEQSQPKSKSGYDDVHVMGGPTSVGGQLADDDTAKKPLFNINWIHERFYKRKEHLKNRYGLALNVDYNFLNQYASFSFDDRRAASGTFRVYGRWSPRWKKRRPENGLVFRFENRHQIGSGTTPRNLGFDAGSALSTASFKDFGWGTTALYWEQGSVDEKIGFVAGQMDPGDWEDLHPLLTAYTAFLNDASFNNPTTALPNQGLGIAVRAFLSDHLYLKGGLHDANGEPTSIDFESFFDVQEYFTWVEVGWAAHPKFEVIGGSVHLTLWHADPREEAGTLESWGVAFSAAHEYGEKWIPYIRAGYSEGGAALLRAMLTLGTGYRVRQDDLLGVAATWGSPPQGEEGRDQFTVEAFYRLQLTHNLQVTPGIQWTLNPAYNLERNSIWVASVFRIRFVL